METSRGAANWIGKTLHEVPTPSVVLDLAKLEANCEGMLNAAEALGLQFRAHIKTHKTTQLTRLQVGDDRTTPVNLCVSTVLEAENITPLLIEYKSKGRQVNVLFGFPIYASAVSRLAAVSAALGRAGLSIMMDNTAQLAYAARLAREAGHPSLVFLKLDTGYGRAGLKRLSPEYADLVREVLAAETRGELVLQGLYSHAGHSYDERRGYRHAMSMLVAEVAGLRNAMFLVPESRQNGLVLSVGATPTATTIQRLDKVDLTRAEELGALVEEMGAAGDSAVGPDDAADMFALISMQIRQKGVVLEVHAGVYPMLDLQQLATHASAANIAMSVMAEVVSLYAGRGAGGTLEALVNCGTLALGREPVNKSAGYHGWGIPMPWGGLRNVEPGPEFPDVYAGWQLGSISQEHGILTWKGKSEDQTPLAVGQRLRIWPNHACVAGSGYDHYLIVDSRNSTKEDEVVEVWPRWRGW